MQVQWLQLPAAPRGAQQHTRLRWPFWRSGLFTHFCDENLKFNSGENVPGSTGDSYSLVIRGKYFRIE